MPTVDLLTPAGKASGTVELPEHLFDVATNVPLIHQVVVAQLAAARQGTHATKTRGMVRGGGRKPYKQKGTGRARQGSTRAPQFVGGGTVHGPQPRDYSQRTPKKMKAAALRGALSDRARHGRIHVFSGLVEGQVPSTKAIVGVLASLSERRNLLVVLDRSDEVAFKSVRNLADVHVVVADQLNTYDVLCADEVVFTADALQAFIQGASAAPTGGSRTVATTSVVQSTAGSAAKTKAKAPTAGTAAPTAKPAQEALPADGEFGSDSAAPQQDGSAPAGFTVKGNRDSMKYHVPGSRWYDNTVAEVWFRTADAAAAAGFVPAGGAKAQQVAQEGN